MPFALKNTAKGYEDAGIVVDIGPISDFAGITATGSGPLVENLWISDGPGAYVPALHPPGPTDFSYGFQQPRRYVPDVWPKYNDVFLTIAEIKAAFTGYEAYAWVGFQSNGVETKTAHVASVNGRSVTADVTLNDVTAAARCPLGDRSGGGRFSGPLAHRWVSRRKTYASATAAVKATASFQAFRRRNGRAIARHRDDRSLA